MAWLNHRLQTPATQEARCALHCFYTSTLSHLHAHALVLRHHRQVGHKRRREQRVEWQHLQLVVQALDLLHPARLLACQLVQQVVRRLDSRLSLLQAHAHRLGLRCLLRKVVLEQRDLGKKDARER
eukprot:350448-Chlamydomonas_euryale.AAC.2